MHDGEDGEDGEVERFHRESEPERARDGLADERVRAKTERERERERESARVRERVSKRRCSLEMPERGQGAYILGLAFADAAARQLL